jgi:hypothetical protein
MSDDLTPEQKFAAEEAGIIVARGLLAGRPRERIEADLDALDWAPGAADRFIRRVEQEMERYQQSEESRRRMRREHRFEMLCGGLLLLLGFLLAGVIWAIFLSWQLTLGALVLVALTGAVVLHRGWTRWQLYRYLEQARKEQAGTDDPVE